MSLHRFVMNAETLKEWHDFKTEAINVSRARAAAARAYTIRTFGTLELNRWTLMQCRRELARVEAVNRESVTTLGNLDT